MTARKIAFAITETGCFQITSRRPMGNGYCRPHIYGIPIYLHRYIYEECFGSITDGLSVCHKCDNPLCINPEHLFLGTQGDNIRDRDAKGRRNSCRGEEHHSAKLNKSTVIDIRNRYLPGDSKNGCRTMARELGVDSKTISNAVNKKTWNWL